MKRIIKFVGVALVILLVLGGAIIGIISNMPVAPTDYQETVAKGGDIEKKYMANGHYEVSVHEDAVLQEFEKITVYYPAELETSSKKYPVIVLCNGSGTPVSKYATVAKHYASWGFVVIGTAEKFAWNAQGAEVCLLYLERWNENRQIEGMKSFFYQKIDFENVGVVGHSQGGVGAINAITETKHRDIYKTAVALSPTNKELAYNLFWDYDASLVNIPIMLISGAGGGDDWVITGDQLLSVYDDVQSGKLMMRRKNTAHGEMLYSADGYVTAWLMWQLQGDNEATLSTTGLRG